LKRRQNPPLTGGAEERRSGGAEERRGGGAEEKGRREKGELIGYKAQEIPPKISFTPPNPSQEWKRRQEAESRRK